MKTKSKKVQKLSKATRADSGSSAPSGLQGSFDVSDLVRELREVRAELSAVSTQLALTHSLSGVTNNQSQAPLPLFLRVFFQRGQGVRKSYRLDVEGAAQLSEGLSAVRAAIFLVLFLDLRDRLEGGDGAKDVLGEIGKVVRLLDPKGTSADFANMLRVAVYRFFDYFEGQGPLCGTELKISFNVEKLRLSAESPNGFPLEKTLQVDLATNDPQIEQILSTSFHSSPLAIVRRRKSLYVPSGPAGSDRLLLEMYNHPYRLRVTSLYVRPPFQSYPERLLKHIGISDRVIERKRLALEGYKQGRFHFQEILPKKVIWNLIRQDKNKRFLLYPEQVTKAQILDHFDNLIHILRTYEHYEFFVTDATIPFALVTYEILSGVVPEYYSVFFQSFMSAQDQDLGCFVLSDPHVYQSISDHVVNWVVAHQSTIREREEVIKFLQKVRRHLDKKGPLLPSEPTP